MGIQGLLPLLKSIHKSTHLKHFSGQTLGVDAYGWLHRGTVSCAIELAEGKPTRKHIDFALHRVRMLIHFGVKPYLVFDGDYLPSKAHTEKERAARRKESKRVGLEMLRMGRPSQAQQELQKAVDVTPAMARELIEELKRLDVPYVVAPYEADSQLAYLEKEGTIQGVVSEDSDLLVFGVKCLLTKLDQYGECVMINRDDFTACKDINLVGWSDKEFRIMAMLSGCDYLPGIDKMGLKTAYRLVRKHKSVERVVRTVQFDGKIKVPKDYLDAFQRAERTFLHQWVFCPQAQCLLHLNPLPPGVDAASMPYIGKNVDAELAAGVACGDLDPNTKEPIALPNIFRHPGRMFRTVSAPLEKHGKPIDEYFKARRVPLAELDVNSFTPSPSQQRLMQSQENRTWTASRIPQPRFFGSAEATNVGTPSTAPQASRRVVTDPIPSHRASPKRQRLCSDSALAAAMKSPQTLESATSRFFAKSSTQPNPSMRRKSTRKQEEFDLWSDDSIAEALAAATEVPAATDALPTAAPRKRKKLQIFTDAKEPAVGTQDSQGSIASSGSTADSMTLRATNTPNTSFESTGSQEQSGFSKSIRLDFEALRYQSNISRRMTPSRTSSAPLLAKTPARLLPLSSETEVFAKRSPSDIDDSGIVLESPAGALHEVIRSEVAEPDDGFVEESGSPICEKHHDAALSMISVKGSEDQIVPESPSQSPDEAPDEIASRPKLNLGKFAFAG